MKTMKFRTISSAIILVISTILLVSGILWKGMEKQPVSTGIFLAIIGLILLVIALLIAPTQEDSDDNFINPYKFFGGNK